MTAVVSRPYVGIVMGSRSDWETMQHAAQKLDALGVPYEVKVVSAHRTPDVLFSYAESAGGRGLRAIIAGAGGAAHLPGMLASKTAVPVLGVPVQSKALNGMDSLLSIVLPCHRVIGADGSLTGFGGGLPTKQFLLQLEGALAPAKDLFG